MSETKTEQALRQINADLQSENQKLKQQVELYEQDHDKVNAKLKELDELKDEWQHEVDTLKQLREQYAKLNSDLHAIRDAMADE